VFNLIVIKERERERERERGKINLILLYKFFLVIMRILFNFFYFEKMFCELMCDTNLLLCKNYRIGYAYNLQYTCDTLRWK